MGPVRKAIPATRSISRAKVNRLNREKFQGSYRAGDQTQDQKINTREIKKDILGIFLLVLAMFIVISDLYPQTTGILGKLLMVNVLFPLVGKGVIILPICIAVIGLMLLFRREALPTNLRMWGAALGFFVFVTVAEVFNTGRLTVFNLKFVSSEGGGVVGLWLSYILQKYIGPSGTYFVLIMSAIISFLLLTGISFIAIYHYFRQTINSFKYKELEPTLQPRILIPRPQTKGKRSILSLIKGVFVGDEDRLSKQKKQTQLNKSTLPKKVGRYQLPPIALLMKRPKSSILQTKLKQQIEQDIKILEGTLASFKVRAKVVSISHGPSVTRYELQPAPGVRVNKIANLADDISLNLASMGVRIEAPIPGRSVVGIEVPHSQAQLVTMNEMLREEEFIHHPSKLFVALGKDISGKPVFGDLTKMPHMLIAGATGSGKSVCLNAIISSILYRATPDEVRFLMIDPKRVELNTYNNIPHLLTPVVHEPKLAASALKNWAIREMDGRYKLFSKIKVRNIDAFNKKVSVLITSGKKYWQDVGLYADQEKIKIEKMPYIVVIIDELADLMLVASGDVEASICRLAQMARAVGIHLVIATQRPSVDVITGLIKANITSRIAFAVSSQIDSRTIIDRMGAEKLLGRGDMLYSPIGVRNLIRLQGVFMPDREIGRIVSHVKKQAQPNYLLDISQLQEVEDQRETAEGQDPLFNKAVEIVSTTGKTSISYLQRKLRIGYNRAARMHEEMADQGIIKTEKVLS